MYATIKGAETIKATQSRLLGVKIAQFCSSMPILYSYMRKCRLKYLEHVLHADKLATAKAQKSSRAVGSDCMKTYFFTSILNNVVVFRQRKRRKYARKCIHRTRTCRSCMSVRPNRHLHSAVDLTRLMHMRAPLTADKSYLHL